MGDQVATGSGVYIKAFFVLKVLKRSGKPSCSGFEGSSEDSESQGLTLG